MTILITVVLILAVFASIAAWINTQTIIKDLTEIKAKLGIKEIKKKSFFDQDLDQD